MAVYGDPALVRKLIRATPGDEPGEDVEARITALNKAISLILEEECQTTWGSPVADTNEVHWIGPYDTLVLNRPARSITSITYGGTLSGTTMTGGTTTLAADLYYPIIDRDSHILAISGTPGTVWSWYGLTAYPNLDGRTPVVVTGDFMSSDSDANIPDDIVYIASYMIAERLKVERASAFGATGPDGDVAPIRDVFGDPLVKRTLAKYRREIVMAV